MDMDHSQQPSARRPDAPGDGSVIEDRTMATRGHEEGYATCGVPMGSALVRPRPGCDA